MEAGDRNSCTWNRKCSACFLKKNGVTLYMNLGHSTSFYSYVSTMCIIEVQSNLKARLLSANGLLTVSLGTQIHVPI